VNVLIQQAVENFDEQSKGNKKCEDTDGNKTTLNWEATAA